VAEQPSRTSKRRTVTTVTGSALQQRRDPTLHERAERWEERLAIPVLVAALVSVPAVFLVTTTAGVSETVGRVLNWASMVVLLGESLVLVLLSKDIVDWVRSHRWELVLALGTVPAVVFAIGPVQILRVILAVGTLRVLRARRILRAGRVLLGKLDIRARYRKFVLGGAVLLAAVFVGIVLANPNSKTHRLLAWTIDQVGLFATVLVLGMLAGTLYVLLRWITLTEVGTLLQLRRQRRGRRGNSVTRADRDATGRALH